jgi:hypothetical protein
MFSFEQYRCKASEYAKLSGTASGTDEVRKFERLERSFAELADNAQWVTENHDKTVHATERASALLTADPPAQSISQQ